MQHQEIHPKRQEIQLKHIHLIIYYLWMFEVEYWNYSVCLELYVPLRFFTYTKKKWMMNLMCLFCMKIFLKYTLYIYMCKFNFSWGEGVLFLLFNLANLYLYYEIAENRMSLMTWMVCFAPPWCTFDDGLFKWDSTGDCKATLPS
jgi:hypothetical protein